MDAAFGDIDGDGEVNYLDNDMDNDGIDNKLDNDMDGDGIMNNADTHQYGADPSGTNFLV